MTEAEKQKLVAQFNDAAAMLQHLVLSFQQLGVAVNSIPVMPPSYPVEVLSPKGPGPVSVGVK